MLYLGKTENTNLAMGGVNVHPLAGVGAWLMICYSTFPLCSWKTTLETNAKWAYVCICVCLCMYML